MIPCFKTFCVQLFCNLSYLKVGNVCIVKGFIKYSLQAEHFEQEIGGLIDCYRLLVKQKLRKVLKVVGLKRH